MNLGINKLGILQGRVIPEQLDKLQLFPISNWKNEFTAIKDIGFHYVELLFDKKLFFKKVLLNFSNLNFFNNTVIQANKLKAGSVCADFLTLFSPISVKTQKHFYECILKLIILVKNTTIKVIVIPFFDQNLIKSKNDLVSVLNWIEEKQLDRIVNKNNIVLALELNLSAEQINEAFLGHRFKNIKVCYDLGNARLSGRNPEDEIIELKRIIAHVHIKDRKINGANVMLGKGDVNFSACFNSLKKINYSGLMILETGYFTKPYSEALKNLLFIKKKLKGINL